jgi:hypothetical protein
MPKKPRIIISPDGGLGDRRGGGLDNKLSGRANMNRPSHSGSAFAMISRKSAKPPGFCRRTGCAPVPRYYLAPSPERSGFERVVIPGRVPIAYPPHDHQNAVSHAGAVLVLNAIQERHNIATLELNGDLIA